jgi:uncharacterized membrane protein YczE
VVVLLDEALVDFVVRDLVITVQGPLDVGQIVILLLHLHLTMLACPHHLHTILLLVVVFIIIGIILDLMSLRTSTMLQMDFLVNSILH